MGRFLHTDPWNYIDGMNLYSYVNNNPIMKVDPLGLFYKYGKCCGPALDCSKDQCGKRKNEPIPGNELDEAGADHDDCLEQTGQS